MIRKFEFGFLVVCLIQIVFLHLTSQDNLLHPVFSLISALICFVCALSFYLAHRMNTRFTKQAALPWLFLSISMLILAAADIYTELHSGNLLAWLLLNILFRCFFLLGILNFPRAETIRLELNQDLSDFFLITLAVGLSYWFFLLAPLSSAKLPAQNLTILLSLFYPVLNISIFWVLARLPYNNFQKGKYASPKVYLVIGFSLYFIINAIGSVQNQAVGMNVVQINFIPIVVALLGMAGFEQGRLISLNGLAEINVDKREMPHPLPILSLEESLAAEHVNLISAYTVMNPYLRDIVLYVRMSDRMIVAANPAAELEYGYSNQEMLQLRISDLRSPDSIGQINAQMQKANTDGILFEAIHRRKDGTLFPVEVRAVGGEYFGQNCNISVIRNISEREKAGQAVRAANVQFERTFASLNEVLFVRHPFEPQIIMVNAACERMLGYAPTELIGNSSESLFASRKDFEYLEETFEKSIKATGRFQLETQVKAKDGHIILAEIAFSEIQDEAGFRIGILGVIHDITSSRHAAIRTYKSEKRYKALFNNMKEGVALLEYQIKDRKFPRLYFLEANTTFFQMLNLTQAQVDGRELNEVMPGSEKRWTELGQKIAVQGESALFQEYFAPLDKIFMINAFSPEAGRFAMLLMDITDQKKAEKKLQDSADRLQALSRRLLIVQEEELRHLGRELHDEIGQALTGLKFNIEAGLEMMPDSQKKSALLSKKIIADLIVQVRELSKSLRPALLDDFGLVQAMINLFDRLRQNSDLDVYFEYAGLETRLSFEIETGVYRMVQEALTNVIRHAGTRQATVRITLIENILQIEIWDKGKGFAVAEILTTTQSVGLTGIFERASLLNGSATIESTPGAGTRVLIRLSLNNLVQKD